MLKYNNIVTFLPQFVSLQISCKLIRRCPQLQEKNSFVSLLSVYSSTLEILMKVLSNLSMKMKNDVILTLISINGNDKHFLSCHDLRRIMAVLIRIFKRLMSKERMREKNSTGNTVITYLHQSRRHFFLTMQQSFL